jgi:hypothetical protein
MIPQRVFQSGTFFDDLTEVNCGASAYPRQQVGVLECASNLGAQPCDFVI